jgi:hypothetical protein
MNRMRAVHKGLHVLGWLCTVGWILMYPIAGLADTMRPMAPFDDLDILGPFANRAYSNSKVESPSHMRLANRLINRLPEFLPGMPRGEPVDGGQWFEKPPTDASGRILGSPEWVGRGIEYAVFAFASPEHAQEAMEGLFSDENGKAWQTQSEESRQRARDDEPTGIVGGTLTAQEWRATGYETAFSWEHTWLGQCMWLEVAICPDNTATSKDIRNVVRVVRTFTGDRDHGGSDYTITTIAGEYQSGEERACFVRRGRHVLAVTVHQWANLKEFDEATGSRLKHCVFYNPPFPTDLWNQVLAIVGHVSADVQHPRPAESREELERRLSVYLWIRDTTLTSISDIQKQIDALTDTRVPYIEDFPNYLINLIWNDPQWTKAELEILAKGYPGVEYLYFKSKLLEQRKTSLQLQRQNLALTDALIADIQSRLRDLISSEEGGSQP